MSWYRPPIYFCLFSYFWHISCLSVFPYIFQAKYIRNKKINENKLVAAVPRHGVPYGVLSTSTCVICALLYYIYWPLSSSCRWMGPIRNPRWEQKRTEGYVIVSSVRRIIYLKKKNKNVQKLYLKTIHSNTNNTSSIELLNRLSNKHKIVINSPDTRYDNVTLSPLLLPARVTNRSHSTYGSSARSDSHRAVFCPNSVVRDRPFN
jgi:hypothetical protein